MLDENEDIVNEDIENEGENTVGFAHGTFNFANGINIKNNTGSEIKIEMNGYKMALGPKGGKEPQAINGYTLSSAYIPANVSDAKICMLSVFRNKHFDQSLNIKMSYNSDTPGGVTKYFIGHLEFNGTFPRDGANFDQHVGPSGTSVGNRDWNVNLAYAYDRGGYNQFYVNFNNMNGLLLVITVNSLPESAYPPETSED